MGHPSLSKEQATIINVVAGGLLALGMLASTMQQAGDSSSSAPSGGAAGASANIAQIDTARIVNADSEPGNWLAYGRDYADVVPVLGVMKTYGEHKATQAVDVVPVPETVR